MLRLRTDVSPCPLATQLSERQNHKFASSYTAKYTEVEPSYKNYHIDIYFKTKTIVTHAAKC